MAHNANKCILRASYVAHTRRTNYAAHTKAKAPLANMHILRRRRLSCETSHGPGLSTYCGRNMRLTIHKNATSGAENVSNYPHIAGGTCGSQFTRTQQAEPRMCPTIHILRAEHAAHNAQAQRAEPIMCPTMHIMRAKHTAHNAQAQRSRECVQLSTYCGRSIRHIMHTRSERSRECVQLCT